MQPGREGPIGPKTRVPVDDIPVMRPWMEAEEALAVAEVVASGWVAQGPRAAEFERRVAAAVGTTHGVAASSGTAALHLALSVLDLGPDDDVVVPSLSYIATANAPRAVGAHPVFADVDATTLDVTPTTIEAALTPATRAVLVVHQAGTPADLDGIHALCDPLGLEVVEDAACALGAVHRGTPIGGNGRLVAFSFHPRKVITTGEGGMVTTADDARAERMRRLRDHGSDVSAWARHQSSVTVERYVEPGFNFRLSDLLAAVGLVQLDRLDAIVARRRELAATYRTLLQDLPLRQVVDDPPWGRGCYQSFWVELDDGAPGARDAVLEQLFADGVLARRGIMAAHREPAFAGVDHGALPVTERMTDHTLILPLFHTMTDREQRRVVDALRAALS